MKYFISFLLFLIFIILSVIYIKISTPVVENIQKQEIKSNKKLILNNFKTLTPNFDYSFPARILYMKIGFNPFKYRIIYKVVIKDADKYALFNIKTILESYNVNYSLITTNKSEIYIFFKDFSQANFILKLFKEYNFNIKITKIKQRI